MVWCAAVVCIAWSFRWPPIKIVPVSWPAACASETPTASTAPPASSRTPWPRSAAARRCGTPPSASCSAPRRKSSGTHSGLPWYQVFAMSCWVGWCFGMQTLQGTSSPCAACGGRTRPASEGKQQKGTRRTESQIPGLVIDLFSDVIKTHCTR